MTMRRRLVAMDATDGEPIEGLAVTLTETDLNRMAQRFYEASGLQIPMMTDKPLIVAGLRASLEMVGVEVRHG